MSEDREIGTRSESPRTERTKEKRTVKSQKDRYLRGMEPRFYGSVDGSFEVTTPHP